MPPRIFQPIIPLLLATALLLQLPAPAAAADGDVQVVTVTAAPSIPSTAPEFVSDDRFRSAILNSTNTYRSQHAAPEVAWNRTLARFADDYLTEEVTDACEFEHSGGPYGENLAIGCSDATGCVEAWGDERERYDFDKAEFGEEIGHFTQLVWRNTSDVGCGRRLCGEKGWYLVCEYWPRGNVIGQFKEMVAKPVDGVSWGGAAGRLSCPPAAVCGLLASLVAAWLF